MNYKNVLLTNTQAAFLLDVLKTTDHQDNEELVLELVNDLQGVVDYFTETSKKLKRLFTVKAIKDNGDGTTSIVDFIVDEKTRETFERGLRKLEAAELNFVCPEPELVLEFLNNHAKEYYKERMKDLDSQEKTDFNVVANYVGVGDAIKNARDLPYYVDSMPTLEELAKLKCPTC